jgi:hypothetical protein
MFTTLVLVGAATITIAFDTKAVRVTDLPLANSW